MGEQYCCLGVPHHGQHTGDWCHQVCLGSTCYEATCLWAPILVGYTAQKLWAHLMLFPTTLVVFTLMSLGLDVLAWEGHF